MTRLGARAKVKGNDANAVARTTWLHVREAVRCAWLLLCELCAYAKVSRDQAYAKPESPEFCEARVLVNESGHEIEALYNVTRGTPAHFGGASSFVRGEFIAIPMKELRSNRKPRRDPSWRSPFPSDADLGSAARVIQTAVDVFRFADKFDTEIFPIANARARLHLAIIACEPAVEAYRRLIRQRRGMRRLGAHL